MSKLNGLLGRHPRRHETMVFLALRQRTTELLVSLTIGATTLYAPNQLPYRQARRITCHGGMYWWLQQRWFHHGESVVVSLFRRFLFQAGSKQQKPSAVTV